MHEKQKGWPPVNMEPKAITTNADGSKTLAEAGKAKNKAYIYSEGPDLVNSRGSVKNIRNS